MNPLSDMQTILISLSPSLSFRSIEPSKRPNQARIFPLFSY